MGPLMVGERVMFRNKAMEEIPPGNRPVHRVGKITALRSSGGVTIAQVDWVPLGHADLDDLPFLIDVTKLRRPEK